MSAEQFDPYTQCLPEISLETKHLIVRTPQVEDIDQWIDVRGRNQSYLKPYEPAWPRQYLTKEYQIKRYVRQMQEWAGDHRYAFIICDKKKSI